MSLFHNLYFNRKVVILLVVLSLVLMSVSISVAQDATEEPDEPTTDTPPVLELLSLVPASINFSGSNFIGFSDFNAAIATRDGAVDYESWDEFQADLDDGTEAGSLLIQSLPLSGFTGAQYLLYGGAEMPELMGFDFFDLDASLNYGVPPAQVTLYQGEFDADQIDAALTNSGYVSDELDGAPYWCAEAGCDTGMMQDLPNRNPANLFGGDLGRRFPVLLMDDVVAASASDTEVEAVSEVYQGENESLADDPNFQTAVSAMYGSFDVEDQPQLRQAYFVPADAVAIVNDPAFFTQMTEEQIAAIRERLMTEMPDPLPLYQLVSLGDFGNSTHQYAQVVLVYSDEADAQTAIEIVSQRLETMNSMRLAKSVQEILDDRQMELLEPVVYADEATGQYAAVFNFEYPLPTRGEQLEMAGLGYRLFLDMIFSRDMLWIASEVALPE
jgi:hypothetical protein